MNFMKNLVEFREIKDSKITRQERTMSLKIDTALDIL